MSNVNFDYKGKKFVVTGASAGMGRQVAVELAAAGAIVLALARREAELDKLKKEYPNNIFISALDVTDKIALENAIKQFVLQNGKLNGAVHAAGISGITPLKGFDSDLVKRITDISYCSSINLLQIINKSKISESGYSCVLFSSVAAYSGEKGMFAYSAAKLSLHAAVKSIAKEICAKNNRVNLVVPGWVKTDMTKEASVLADTGSFFDKHLLGAGIPSDVSGVVLFLLSDRASWITGADIVVDGGYLA